MSKKSPPYEGPRHVTAERYVRLAGLDVSGRTLQRWCDARPQLGRALGEIKLPGKRLYDGHTAAEFARHWWDSQ